MSQDKLTKKVNLTRREALKFLGAGATATLTAQLSTGADLPQQGEARHSDVIVVGAGFAGMVAARNLIRAGKKVVVLEARDRIGGRIKAGKIAGQSVDVGGMWVGPTQTQLLAMIKEYGLHTTPQYEDGKSIVELDGKRTSGEREELGLDPTLQKELDGLLAELDRLAAQVPLDAPWTAPQAEEFDNITVQDWFDAHTKNKAMLGFFQMLARTYHAADTKQMSFLFFLFYLHTCDTFESLIGIKNAAQAFRVIGGLHGVAAKLAGELGQVVVLEAPVQTISQDASGVVVHSQKGSWHADYAVVAVPLPLSVRISYDPPLPPHRDVLAQRMPMGSVIKYWVAYERPFWREHGLSGITLSDLPPSAGCYDCTPTEGKPGLLVGFIEANNALRWTGRPREERKKLIVGRMVDWFGPEAAKPIDYEDQDWPAEQWSRGCYEAWTGPGVLTTVGKAIREPVGRIYWAGTETSPQWMGYVEGAIRSGERAAAEVQGNYKRK